MKKLLMQTSLIILLLMFNPFINNTSADDRDVPFVYLYYRDLATINQDGIIGSNEYPSNFIMENLAGEQVAEVWWAHDNTTLAIGIRVNGTGWIGFGFGEVGVSMSGANIVMASYNPTNNQITIQDMFSSEQDDPVVDEVQYAFPSTGGSEIDGFTTIEFTVPLQSNDAQGHDHFWHIDGRFGFFTAFKRNNKAFDRIHSEHSQSETVDILDKSFAPPIEADFLFSIIDNLNGTIILRTKFTGLTHIDDHEVGFFQQTIFGNVFIGDVFSNDVGIGEILIRNEKTGTIDFVALFYGDINHVRSVQRESIDIPDVSSLEVDEKYDDLRDIVGSHFMRNIMIFMLFFFSAWLVYLYSTTLVDILKIKRIGMRISVEKKEIIKNETE